MVARQGCEPISIWGGRWHPGQLRDLGGRSGVAIEINLVKVGDDRRSCLVGGWRGELAQKSRGAEANAATKLLPHLARKGSQRILVGVDLATRAA